MSVDWIRANAVAALVSFILGVATFGLRQMLGLPDPEAGAFARALQALVLRKAAREIGDWIRWSALAGTTLGGYALALGIGSDQPLRDEVLVQLLGFAIAIVAGIVMLPALLRLRPH